MKQKTLYSESSRNVKSEKIIEVKIKNTIAEINSRMDTAENESAS